MNNAKAAVKDFLHKDGKHDTTVHESVNSHVTNETVKPTQHHEHTQAVDKEIHQHHHDTTVQPIHDRQVLPEKHVHEAAPVEHREFRHGNDDHIKQKLSTEAAQFKDTHQTHETTHTKVDAPIMGSEHHHHHVHETVQPVIHKEVVQPTVVHHTNPIHETHHHEAKHHGTTTLPAVTMDELKRQGGHLGEHKTRTDAFQGEPNAQERYLGGKGAAGTTSLTSHDPNSQGTDLGHNQQGVLGHQNGAGIGNNQSLGSNSGAGVGQNNAVGLGTNQKAGGIGHNQAGVGHEHGNHASHEVNDSHQKESLLTKIKKVL